MEQHIAATAGSHHRCIAQMLSPLLFDSFDTIHRAPGIRQSIVSETMTRVPLPVPQPLCTGTRP